MITKMELSEMTVSKEKRADLVIELANMFLDTIKATGDRGAPTGHMYTAVMGVMSLEQFQGFMTGLQKAGKIVVRGHVAYAVKQ